MGGSIPIAPPMNPRLVQVKNARIDSFVPSLVEKRKFV